MLIFWRPILKNFLSHGANSGFVLNWYPFATSSMRKPPFFAL